MKLSALINFSSGSVPKDAVELLSAALQERGVSATISQATNETLQTEVKTCVANGPDVLIVWGGDGTIACALNEVGTNLPVLPLPGGTMNLMSNRAHGPGKPWESCLIALFDGTRPSAIGAGEVAGQRFYLAAMLGSLVELAEPREKFRNGKILSAARQVFNGNAMDLSPDLTVQLPGESTFHQTAAIALVVPENGSGNLTLASLNPDSLIDLTAVGLSALLNGWEDASGIDCFSLRTAQIFSNAGASLQATLDGEPRELSAPASFCWIESAASILGSKS